MLTPHAELKVTALDNLPFQNLQRSVKWLLTIFFPFFSMCGDSNRSSADKGIRVGCLASRLSASLRCAAWRQHGTCPGCPAGG